MMDDVFKAALARAARMQAETDAHRESCTARPCDRCRRYCCTACKAHQDFDGPCDSCRAEQARNRWAKHALAAIPRGFSEASLDAGWLSQLVGARVITEARASLTAERVIAVGPPGSGKTSLIAAMLVGASVPSTHKPTIVWASAHQLAKARTLHPLGEGEAPLIARALDATLLVIDELGGEDQRYASAVTEVIYERHAQMQPTWITSGVGPKEITDRYGSGIARRVFEDATVFRLVGRPK